MTHLGRKLGHHTYDVITTYGAITPYDVITPYGAPRGEVGPKPLLITMPLLLAEGVTVGMAVGTSVGAADGLGDGAARSERGATQRTSFRHPVRCRPGGHARAGAVAVSPVTHRQLDPAKLLGPRWAPAGCCKRHDSMVRNPPPFLRAQVCAPRGPECGLCWAFLTLAHRGKKGKLWNAKA